MIRSSFAYMVLFLTLPLTVILAGCQNSTKDRPEETTSSAESPGESIYLAEGKWDNQHGDSLRLGDLKGKIPVVSMVFTKCTFACPRIVGDMQAIEKQVPAGKKDKVVFVLISFDSERDHTSELAQFTRQMKLGNNWQVLHGDAESVRELSMLLDVKYKKQENGDFTHSSSIALLDTEGAIASRVEGLGADPGPIIKKIESM